MVATHSAARCERLGPNVLSRIAFHALKKKNVRSGKTPPVERLFFLCKEPLLASEDEPLILLYHAFAFAKCVVFMGISSV